ncbi:response regulator [Lyngbya sp. CCY1209]|uniref:sensor histidine kinase n=1 Tax=Lyngbya sp. CCY1209 TaxID=2886103 RepID=UPI002D1FEB0B|nr:response regulator [Lyngbya sp. CCY1209]MEB3885870.1 hybrid sensor histidine kinase/response regulator [Lyngbya sp. CCY1209]
MTVANAHFVFNQMDSDNIILREADLLVVDDVPENLKLLSTMLADFGFSVRKAISGKMALTAVNTLTPDLILLDINMPEMNGYQVCEILKQNPETRDIPIIFISAIGQVEDKVKAFQVGGADYITKPFEFEEVIARIKNQLQIRQLQQNILQQNRRLKQTTRELQRTQAQLVQKQKMLGLSQFVAGMFHEINNPINFISGNLEPASEYIRDLMELVDLYREEYPQPSEKIANKIDKIDLDFVMEDVRKLMESMKTGVERISTVMLALRIFSRLNEAEIKSVNLNESLDSVLFLIKPRLSEAENSPPIQIVKNYQDLPKVTGYASQINQVFMHLINNAIDALKAAHRERPGASGNPTIWIATERVNPEWVAIRVRDNGVGIPEAFTSRLFDPFFTTKPVGKGIGLGLSTSYQIVVQKHGGQLTFHSTPGEGTEFRVELPVTLPEVPPD